MSRQHLCISHISPQMRGELWGTRLGGKGKSKSDLVRRLFPQLFQPARILSKAA
jgi:hypothetical protein